VHSALFSPFYLTAHSEAQENIASNFSHLIPCIKWSQKGLVKQQ